MNRQLNELHIKTQEFAGRIDQVTAEELLQLLELRDEVIAVLGMEGMILSKEDKDCLHDLRAYDSIILDRMNHIKTEASEAVNRIRTSNMQRKIYDADFSGESYFIDKKK